MHRTSLAILILLLFPACDKIKEQAEDKAKEEIAAKVAEKALGGSLKAGELCPDWPKNVPLYPGAHIIACQTIDATDGGNPEIAAALAKREGKQPGPLPNVSKVMTLGTEVKATPDEIVAFYKKSLPSYESATSNGQAGMAAMTELANKKDAADPVYAILLMPMDKGSDPATTSSSIMVTLKQK